MRWALLLVGVALVTAGCGATRASSPPAHGAVAVVRALKLAGLPIADSATYTTATDPNALLGRPGQYTAKVNFWDARLQRESPDAITPTDGGSVETFASVADATARFKIMSVTSTAAGGIFNEYDYQDGTVLLRVSHFLTPDQAAQYAAALKQVAG